MECRILVLVALLGWLPAAQGKVQFDVVPGYDNLVRAGAWYPVMIEVFNDGPSFEAVVELSGGQFGSVLTRVPVELPTHTRKRFAVPLFCPSQSYLAVNGRLLDSRGRVQDEQPGQRVALVGWEVPLLGSLPGNFGGTPSFPVPERTPRVEWQPRVARLQSETFPDRSLALEGLNSLYLNTARALELKEPQVQALVTWLESGGQLIVVVDQPNDLTSLPWLRDRLPADVGGQTNVRLGSDLHRWLTQSDWRPQFAFQTVVPQVGEPPVAAAFSSLVADPAVETTDIPLFDLRLREGEAVPSTAGQPWLVSVPRGRGQLVLLAVNPEREPLKSWKHRPWFWARLCGVPARFLESRDGEFRGGRGLDGLFGAMIETRQIRKLPIGVLLLLLLVYLAVIGPFDQWWLKKINRPMLTWITFPLYVLLFSGLIYFIGYKLRAGQTEWNELQVVDILPGSGNAPATLRGRTFGSLYSPANATYSLVNPAQEAAIRPEFKNLFGGSPDSGRLTVTLGAQQLEAELFVPVWTSTLNVSEWVETDTAPVVARRLGSTRFEVENRGRQTLGPLWVVSGHRVASLPELRPGALAEVDLSPASESLTDLMVRRQSEFAAAVSQRETTFGSGDRQPIDDWAEAAMAASFPSLLGPPSREGQAYIWPAGFDLSSGLRRGQAVLLAWLPDTGVMRPLNQFSAPRSRRGALLRLEIPNPP